MFNFCLVADVVADPWSKSGLLQIPARIPENFAKIQILIFLGIFYLKMV